VDAMLAGEVGSISEVDTPNDLYMRYFSSGYGLSQALGTHKLCSSRKYGFTSKDAHRAMANLNGTIRVDLRDVETHHRPVYRARQFIYLNDHEKFDPDVQWPTSWFRNPMNVVVKVDDSNTTVVSWQTPVPTDMDFRWTSDGEWEYLIRGGVAVIGPDGRYRNGLMQTEHVVPIMGLKPGTVYEFKIRSSNKRAVPGETIWGQVGKFETE